jgi:hypothetical protein
MTLRWPARTCDGDQYTNRKAGGDTLDLASAEDLAYTDTVATERPACYRVSMY